MHRILRTGSGLLIPLLIYASWHFASKNEWLPPSLLPAPERVYHSFAYLLGSGELSSHIAASLSRLGTGFSIGALLGLITGLVIGLSRVAEGLFGPTMQFISPIPPIVWIPLLIAIFGIGEESKVALLSLASFFLVATHTFEGIRSTDSKLVDVAKLYRKGIASQILFLFVPSALPHIFLGLRLALSLSWILLIAAEVIASSHGLGWLVWDARTFSRPDDMFVGILTIGILGKSTDATLVWVSQKATHWSDTFDGRHRQ